MDPEPESPKIISHPMTEVISSGGTAQDPLSRVSSLNNNIVFSLLPMLSAQHAS